MQRAPIVHRTQQVVVEVTTCIGGTNRKVDVHSLEQLPHIGNLQLESSRGSKTIRAVYTRCTTLGNVVEHEFIADGDSKDVIRAVRLQSLLDGRLLALIGDVVLVDDVDRGVDFNVGLRLLDCFQDERGLVAVGAVEADAGCDLREKLHVSDRIGKSLVA